jgi:Na+-translocating ferredoxin:NAD+ oxidoreductase RNF subunit RnfB
MEFVDNKTETLKKIINALPRANCGHCGYGNCGGFALAVYEGRASPFHCVVHYRAGYEICRILGMEVPEEWKDDAAINPGAELSQMPAHSHHGIHRRHSLKHAAGDGRRHHRGGHPAFHHRHFM